MFIKIGDVNNKVALLQESLKVLGFFNSSVDSDFGPLTEAAVIKLQRGNKILADGVVGKTTAIEINRMLKAVGSNIVIDLKSSFINNNFNNNLKKLKWVKCPADIFPGRGGYSSLTLRSDTAKKYCDLYDDVKSMGGIVTTAGGKRSINSKSSPSRSRKSMHYVGLAFDLALPTGMQDAYDDPFVITASKNGYWEVWCRTDDVSISFKTLEAVIATSKSGNTKTTKVIVKDRFFSFTELANNHGFKPIKPRRSFLRGGSYTGAEWWHFQLECFLVRGSTRFGDELLKTYDISKAENFVYWKESKDCIFGINWF